MSRLSSRDRPGRRKRRVRQWSDAFRVIWEAGDLTDDWTAYSFAGMPVRGSAGEAPVADPPVTASEHDSIHGIDGTAFMMGYQAVERRLLDLYMLPKWAFGDHESRYTKYPRRREG